jgi:hypothetical protein
LRALRLQHVLSLRIPVHRLEHDLPFDRTLHDLEREQQENRHQSKLDSQERLRYFEDLNILQEKKYHRN